MCAEANLHLNFIRQSENRRMKSADQANLTHVYVERSCACPFSIAEDYAIDFLKEAERGGDKACVYAQLPGPLPALTRGVKFSFGLSEDVTDKGRRHEEILLRWSGGSRFYPDFSGTVRFRIEHLHTRIMIEGAYRPPFGRVGKVFDSFAGRWIAERTLGDLATRISVELETKEQQWRKSALA